MDGPDDAVEAAEALIHRWDSSSSSSDRMLFDGHDRSTSDLYLHAVDEIRHRSLPDSLQIAMARLEDEFRHILVSRVNPLEADSLLSDLTSLSFSSTGDYSAGEDDDVSADADLVGRTPTAASSAGSSWQRSTSSIREIDLLPPDAVHDLRSIAERMIASGYDRECFQAYSGVRKVAVDHSLRELGVEKLSIGEVQRLPWETLERKIRQWIRAARACIRIVFASERRLCDQVFEDSGSELPFSETVKGAALQLFGFAEAISIGRRSPEKLFKILDLHDTISDLLPDVEALFVRPNSPVESSIHTQASEILSRLAEAVRGTLSEFENAVHQELSRTPVPGGTIHPLTRYVMNYISLIAEYNPTLSQLIVSKPAVANRLSGEESSELSTAAFANVNFPEPENPSPLAAHIVWIIAILDSNIEGKSKLYRDTALAHIFHMNNVHYIVQKAKGLPELRELIGDDYLRRLTGKFQQVATSYERAAWVRVLSCLRDEGIHVSGSFSSGVSRSTLRERFRSFNAAFDETHRTQSAWSVPDPQLREELRISISEKVLPAYRSFLGRFRQHIESGRHPEMYIKYTVEDLEVALADLFEGNTPSQQGRRR